MYAAWLRLTEYCNAWFLTLPWLINPRDLRVTQNAYFSLLIHTKQLSFVVFSDPSDDGYIGFVDGLLLENKLRPLFSPVL